MISTLPVKDLPNPGGLGILVFLCALREESSGRAEDSEGPGPGVLRCPLWAGSALQPVACRGRVSGCRERKAAGACSASSLRMPARLCFPVPPPPPLPLLAPCASPSLTLPPHTACVWERLFLPRASDLRCSDTLCHLPLECHHLLLSLGQKRGDRLVV